jgi:hypothetical protein
MKITRFDSKCVIRQANTSKIVESEVHEFKEKEKLVVVLNKSVKLNMVWNGKFYEGKMAGLDFLSEGPKVTTTTTGR